jgi:hypothetical protein
MEQYKPIFDPVSWEVCHAIGFWKKERSCVPEKVKSVAIVQFHCAKTKNIIIYDGIAKKKR